MRSVLLTTFEVYSVITKHGKKPVTVIAVAKICDNCVFNDDFWYSELAGPNIASVRSQKLHCFTMQNKTDVNMDALSLLEYGTQLPPPDILPSD